VSRTNNNARGVEVIISGLGPTGLVLAHMLGMRGHKVVVLEREPVFYGNARAVYTDDECMRIFQHIGAAVAVQKDMLLETPVQFTRPDGTVMGQYRPMTRPFGWPVVNFFYQPYLETTLTELLSRHPNVEVRRGRELVSFEQDDSGVTVTHQATQVYRFTDGGDAKATRGGEADIETLRAQYLVGADGGRSAVRTQLGIEMTGKNFPEPWLVVDLKAKGSDGAGLRHIPYFNFVVDPKLPVVSCVQPDGYHRFEFMLMPGMTKEWMEQDDTVRMLLSKYVDPDQFEVKRKLVYTFNALMAKEWRKERVLLAGDAAHMTPQFMGQGASSGVRDAYNLGWKLSAVLKGISGDALLDSYERERRDHAQAMINVSVWMKDMVSMTNPLGTALRDAVLKASKVVPPMRRYLQEGGFKPTPVYTRGQYLGLPRRGRAGPEGALSPQPNVRRFNGRSVLLDELLGPGFALVGLEVDPRAALDAASLATLDRLNARYATLYPYGGRPQATQGVDRSPQAGLVEVEDLDGTMVEWFHKAGGKPGPIAILRPDKFTFAVVDARQARNAIAELGRQLALQAAA
jgi:3-(3-hydroxy-phenyl)propionate hydroxylase